MSVEIEQLDIFGLGRMWWQGQVLRECLTDQARFEIRLPAPGCKHGGLVIDVAQDAAGRWWSGFDWTCYLVPDGAPNGAHTPIDAYRATTREEAIRLAAAALLESLPALTTGAAARILDTWRRELAALARAEAEAGQ